MKKLIFTILFLSSFGNIISQIIPTDSLYLGQTVPSNTPKIFQLPISVGLRPIERITISKDDKTLIYSEIDTYPPSVLKIKYFKFFENKWQGPFDLFDGYMAPSLSANDSTLFMQKSINGEAISFYSNLTINGWSEPKQMLNNNEQSHYLQQTNLKHFYISTKKAGTENADLAKVEIIGNDTTIKFFGNAINSTNNELDFFIDRDEEFIIVARSGNLFISYNKGNENWTNAKLLPNIINTSNWEYGPNLSNDKKYLFFTHGGAAMSTYYTYWIKIDNIIDSLKYTNYQPYLNKIIPNQTGNVGLMFNYTLSDSLFIDDDGNNTLTYSAKLSNGAALPTWLTFDASTGTFSGVPEVVKTYTVSLTAKDTANATINTTFKITIGAASGIDEENKDCFKIYPNPTTDVINIVLNENVMGNIEISNMEGKNILSKTINGKCIIELKNQPKGYYLVKLLIDENIIIKKVLLK